MVEFGIQLFGSFALKDARGEVVPLSAKKARALLAFLALGQHEEHPRDKLATLLWEDVPDLQARTSLRQALASLRPVLGRLGATLKSTPETVSLDLPPDCLDVERFERLLGSGVPEAVREAAVIYRGELLDGLHVRASAFEDWLAAERQRLRELALQALSHILDDETARGEWEHGVHTALRLLAFDPLRESAHRSLMLLYARTGRQALALRQYERCRDLLRAELDLAPEAATEALFREIREQRRRPVETAAPAATPPAHPSPAPTGPEPELRQIAILVTDLDLAGDPEEAHRQMVRFREVTADIAERHRAVWRRHGASGVLLAFGARRIRADECTRAIEAAQAIHDAMALGGGPAARVGIAFGLVLVPVAEEDSALTFTGETVAASEELARYAAPGTTLIADSVRATCGDRLRAVPASVGSAAHPVAAWRSLGWPRRAAAFWRSPFVGREAERHQFEIVAERCRAAGEACIIYVRGEAGIGKSRLADRFRMTALGLGYEFHSGSFVDFGLEPGGGGVRMLVRSLVGAEADSEPAEIASRLDAVQAAGLVSPECRMFVELVLNLPGSPEDRRVIDAMDSGARYAGARDAVVKLISNLCRQAPRLLLLEDFHWADREARAFLAAIVERLVAAPAVVVLTARPDQDPVDRAWRAATRSVPLVTMDLTPLRPEEARLVARSYPVPDERRDTCVERAAGNAFFLEQLLVSHDESEEDVPDSVRGVVLSRLERLQPADRAAVQAASVLGQRLALEPLEYLLDDPSYGCEALVDSALLRLDGEEYVFDHALVRDAVYASLLRSRRRLLHARAAEWYAGRDKVLYAQHLDCAGDERAAAAYLDAAQAVQATYRLERALKLAEAAARAAADTDTAAAALLLAGELLRDLGRVRESRDRLERVLGSETVPRHRCHALTGIAAAYRLEDRTPEALAALKEAEALSVDDLDCARIHLLRANLLFAQGSIRECEIEHERALRSARKSGSAELEVQALGGLGDGCYARGDMRQAMKHFDACVRRAREGGFPRVEAAHLSMLAITKHFCLRRDEALADVAAGVRLAVGIGDLRSELLGELIAAEIHHGEADAGPIDERLPRIFHLVERIGSRRFLSEALVFKAHALRLRGETATALECLEEALRICRETGMGYLGGQVLGALAAIVEDPERRRELLDEGESVLGAGAVAHNHLFFYRDAIRACVAEGRWDAAEAYADKLEDVGRTAEGPLPWAALHAAAGRLRAARGRGLPGPAGAARIHADCLSAGMERLAAHIEPLAPYAKGQDLPGPGA